VLPNIRLDYIVLRYWYIYIGVPLRNTREGGCVGADGLAALGARSDRLRWRCQENPKTLDVPPGWNS
jgi:hypothetical protein